ncbi:hypothetical protein RJ639_005962 [Escallonia herrerae]|uniref:TLDc domain-containing protein n=1 Tax=Escallonia herrerae TaxID=1293975 RepID=A0AA88VZZ7_9ASTE|nr:hypothetical protein RJ639_005962 [Escallonia herrerae]
MGNAHSPAADPRFVSATRAFTQKELEDLKSLFVSLAAQSQSNGRHISPSVFKEYIGVRGPLADRMFELVTRKRGDHTLTFEDLVIAKGTYEKGTNEEIEEFIYQLSDVNGDGTLGSKNLENGGNQNSLGKRNKKGDNEEEWELAEQGETAGEMLTQRIEKHKRRISLRGWRNRMSDLEAVLTAIIERIFSHRSAEPGSASLQETVHIFLDTAKFSNVREGCTGNFMSFEEFRRWCNLLPSVRKFLGSLLMPSDSGGGNFHTILLGMWIRNDEGPTVLIIKDKEGYIYGGYASQRWQRHADFYGDMKSFLFQLYPQAAIFRPTGANSNLQWCAVNFSSESIPNGIGFGGRINHFGMFLSANFDQGHTFSCTTFGSPCMSKANQIYPEVIECWGVVPKGPQQERQNGVKGTVLERFKEDRNMLNMVGLANSSQ